MKKSILLFTTLFASTLLASCSNQKTYTVSFDSNGGSSVASQVVQEGGLLSKPDDPSKEGYTFINWTYQDTAWDFENDKVTSDMTLLANYSENEYGYTVNFVNDEHTSVYIYETQDMSKEGTLSTTGYSRDGTTGELLHDGNGQINFKVVVDEGYELDTINITPETSYTNLKVVDGVINGRRITKITSNLTVNITSKEEEAYGFKGTFAYDSHCSIQYIEKQSDTEYINLGEDKIAYSRDGTSGELLHDGNGQINFKVNCDTGYTVDTVSVTPVENFNNCKLISAEDHSYRVTKMTGDVVITITTKIDEGTVEAYKASFNVTGGNATITVYDNNEFQSVKETGITTTYTRDKSTGEFTKDSENAQVNFSIAAEGYTVVVSATEGAYKNIKDVSSTTGIENSYSITKVNQDIVITITLTAK